MIKKRDDKKTELFPWGTTLVFSVAVPCHRPRQRLPAFPPPSAALIAAISSHGHPAVLCSQIYRGNIFRGRAVVA